VVILAGGAGSRMSTVTRGPKSLMEIQGLSVLEWQIKFFYQRGVTNFFFLLGHFAKEIEIKLKLLERIYPIVIDIEVENQPRGTAGALLSSLSQLKDYFFLIHGDILVNTELRKLENAIVSENFDFALTYHPTNHPDDSDLLIVDNHSKVSKIITKPHSLFRGRALGNAGLYAAKKESLLELSENYLVNPIKQDLDRELIPHLLEIGKTIAAVRNVGLVKDVGTPERFAKVENEFSRLQQISFRRPAVFLDRDGTINKLKGFIKTPDQIELMENVGDVISTLNKIGFWIIVITNQPVISRGEVTMQGLEEIHGHIERLLMFYGAIIDDFFYCPHHPDSGFKDELKELKILCDCRKPEDGLIKQALSIYPINLEESWVVGDSWRDIELANRVGLKSIFLGEDDNSINSDYKASSLISVLEIIKRNICEV
jgi:mannose-1-phosphate guanylyltransferase/phosphomannomutase